MSARCGMQVRVPIGGHVLSWVLHIKGAKIAIGEKGDLGIVGLCSEIQGLGRSQAFHPQRYVITKTQRSDFPTRLNENGGVRSAESKEQPKISVHSESLWSRDWAI